ncbi:MAG: AAA domain-containing protein, partial [Elusimicrobiota bacterium]
MAGKEHFAKLLELLEKERLAEKEENLRELKRFPLATRESLGKTVTGLVLESMGSGLGGCAMVTVSRVPKGEELAPFHAMSAGDRALLTFPAGSQPRECEGTLYKVDEYQAVVALNCPEPSPLGRGGYQIDLLGSDATYRRMKKALATAADARKNRTAALREVFLGERAADKRRSRKVRLFNESLNEFQRKAVTDSLAASDAAVIHGPPGTGKTTVLVEIIRQAAAAGERILATAPSNIAVDNMLEKLQNSGLRLVRLGHPARTLESLRHSNLAVQIEADPAYVEVQELDAWRERLVKRKSRFGRGQLGYEEAQDRGREITKLWREARDIENEISRRLIASAQVVLSTHGGLSRNLVKGSFDLVVLDEASQATEPLSWIPLTMGERAILAGDAMQLPPTIYSQSAAAEGLA